MAIFWKGEDTLAHAVLCLLPRGILLVLTRSSHFFVSHAYFRSSRAVFGVYFLNNMLFAPLGAFSLIDSVYSTLFVRFRTVVFAQIDNSFSVLSFFLFARVWWFFRSRSFSRPALFFVLLSSFSHAVVFVYSFITISYSRRLPCLKLCIVLTSYNINSSYFYSHGLMFCHLCFYFYSLVLAIFAIIFYFWTLLSIFTGFILSTCASYLGYVGRVVRSV